MNAFTDFAGPGTQPTPSTGPATPRNRFASPVCATAFGGTSTEERLLAQYRARNGMLDRLFYHVEPEDEARVVRCDHQQGSIIVVHPDPKRDLGCFPDPVAFLADPAADEVIAIDPNNPTTAARLVQPLCAWRRQDAARQALMQRELERVLAIPNLSKNTYEMVSKSLA